MAVEIKIGDCRDVLAGMADQSVNCIVTSPPYFGLRDYGHEGQMGLEPTPDEFVAALVAVLREARRVLRDDGTLWLNLGDSYAANRKYQVPSTKGGKKHGPGQAAGGRGSRVPDGLKPKDLLMIPARVALALQADGWWLRSHIIWNKPNVMPESVRDRPTSAHESIFLLTKAEKYYFDHAAVREAASPASLARIGQANFANQTGGPKDYANGTNPSRSARKTLENFAANPGRNIRNVWTVPTTQFSGGHFAVFPPDLIEPCILAGCPVGGTVLDPFFGAGTTGLVASRLGRNAIGIELNPEYAAMARERIDAPPVKSKAKRKPANDNGPVDLFGAVANA